MLQFCYFLTNVDNNNIVIFSAEFIDILLCINSIFCPTVF
jgi:hypothetical protein